MSVPPATISAQRKSYSSSEPSTQWMAAGSVSSAIFSTHFCRCSFRLRGAAVLRVLCSEIVFGICDVALIFQNIGGQAGFQLPRFRGGDCLVDGLDVPDTLGGEKILEGFQTFCGVDGHAVFPCGAPAKDARIVRAALRGHTQGLQKFGVTDACA